MASVAESQTTDGTAFKTSNDNTKKSLWSDVPRRLVTICVGIPFVWKLQLISEIFLSATHAECAGLSNSLQALTPTCDLIKDTLEQLKLTSKEKPKMSCEAFEDNQTACQLASNQQLSQ